ncbi:hypothetical protein [Streptomyces sp. HNM0574]|uniref:hypothetical protein n=1 Tax=Streptomyces sp. HNM0574 TaxID=2714954 RepID=UPI00146BE828|nr:hypothetical protein [Streptomyces sp. HNM0574]NLU69803.1 hypothetical protein [Streptomyces sp. HNM0574]
MLFVTAEFRELQHARAVRSKQFGRGPGRRKHAKEDTEKPGIATVAEQKEGELCAEWSAALASRVGRLPNSLSKRYEGDSAWRRTQLNTGRPSGGRPVDVSCPAVNSVQGRGSWGCGR